MSGDELPMMPTVIHVSAFPSGTPEPSITAEIRPNMTTVDTKPDGGARGEEPGTTGQWGVWEDLGACHDGDADGGVFPNNVFAPYLDILLYSTFSINDMFHQTGQKYY